MAASRLLLGAIFGTLAALCLQLAGIKRGVAIFLTLFALLVTVLVFYVALMAIG
jgi:hypothetical protein